MLGDIAEDSASSAVRVLSAWPRGLPQTARLTLVEVGSIIGATVDELEDLLTLLGRAERVQCHIVGGFCADLEELIPRLHATPSEVLLEVLMEGNTRTPSTVTLRLAVGEGPSGGGGSVGGQGRGEMSGGGEGHGSGAAAGSGAGQGMGDSSDSGEGDAEADGDPGQGGQEEAAGGGMQLPTAEELLTWAVEEMEGRARREGVRQRQGLEGGRGGPGPDSSNADEEGEEEEGKERGSFEHWWRYGRWVTCHGDWRVLLLAGPGVTSLAAHSTAEGEAALEGALGELLRTCRKGGQRVVGSGRWEYMALPGDGSILLYWDGGKAVEAVVRAMTGAAAAALGRAVPAGDVRAVALPPCTLNSAREGLNACARKVRRMGNISC